MSETSQLLYQVSQCLSHGQWVSLSFHLTSRAPDKETGNTDTLNSAECILWGPTTVFKALQWLKNNGGEKTQSVTSNDIVQLGREGEARRIQHNV